MSLCSRCGAAFGCAMADAAPGPCWCTELPPAVPVPGVDANCWCPDCLRAHIAAAALGTGSNQHQTGGLEKP
ncbi:cysteine-rich CWC family protein [Massilia sp. GCM10023247]|uniref:cysteine-rich CWC family protein n=1 Tax=Massilia sp. GCM10023247 TaxID=3252643 RepID=UPI00360A5C9B